MIILRFKYFFIDILADFYLIMPFWGVICWEIVYLFSKSIGVYAAYVLYNFVMMNAFLVRVYTFIETLYNYDKSSELELRYKWLKLLHPSN